MAPSHSPNGCPDCWFAKSFRHPKTGKIIVAAAYGKKVFFFRCKKHKTKK